MTARCSPGKCGNTCSCWCWKWRTCRGRSMRPIGGTTLSSATWPRSMRLFLGVGPVIVVTGHFGNFELGGYALGVLGSHLHRRWNLDNPYLDRYLAGFRAATGQHLIPKNGGYDQIEAGAFRRRHDGLPGRPICRRERLLGGVFSVARPRHTRRLPCWPWNTMPRWPSAMCCGGMGRCGSRWSPPPSPIRRASFAAVGTVRDITQWYHGQLEQANSPRLPISIGGSIAAGRIRGRNVKGRKLRRPVKSEIEARNPNKSQ